MNSWNNRKLKSISIGETDALIRQLKAVRWYIEEVQTYFLGIPGRIHWRAWCISAIPRERCIEMYAKMPTTLVCRFEGLHGHTSTQRWEGYSNQFAQAV